MLWCLNSPDFINNMYKKICEFRKSYVEYFWHRIQNINSLLEKKLKHKIYRFYLKFFFYHNFYFVNLVEIYYLNAESLSRTPTFNTITTNKTTGYNIVKLR